MSQLIKPNTGLEFSWWVWQPQLANIQVGFGGQWRVVDYESSPPGEKAVGEIVAVEVAFQISSLKRPSKRLASKRLQCVGLHIQSPNRNWIESMAQIASFAQTLLWG